MKPETQIRNLRAEIQARDAESESLQGQLQEALQNVRELSDSLAEVRASGNFDPVAAEQIAGLLRRKRQLEAERDGYMVQNYTMIRSIKSLQRKSRPLL